MASHGKWVNTIDAWWVIWFFLGLRFIIGYILAISSDILISRGHVPSILINQWLTLTHSCELAVNIAPHVPRRLPGYRTNERCRGIKCLMGSKPGRNSVFVKKQQIYNPFCDGIIEETYKYFSSFSTISQYWGRVGNWDNSWVGATW